MKTCVLCGKSLHTGACSRAEVETLRRERNQLQCELDAVSETAEQHIRDAFARGRLEGLAAVDVDRSKDLLAYQKEVVAWGKRNFGEQPAHRFLLGMLEELGELSHAHLKQEQGIRGTNEEHEAAG